MRAVTGAGDLRDARRLAELEVVIERGKAAFIEVGEALIEVRGSRLYRLQYGTFEDYCRQRWGFAHNYANRLMSAATVAEIVPIGTENQARELAPLLRSDGQDAVREAWSEAVARSDGKPTAKVVREVVAEIIEKEAAVGVDPVDEEAMPTETEVRRVSWTDMEALVDLVGRVVNLDTAEVAATVPTRRRAATARRLRMLGTGLGRIALHLERMEREL